MAVSAGLAIPIRDGAVLDLQDTGGVRAADHVPSVGADLEAVGVGELVVDGGEAGAGCDGAEVVAGVGGQRQHHPSA